MKIAKPNGCNKVFVAPKGWNPETDGECADLPARIEQDGPNNPPQIISAWKPTDEELKMLNAGGQITLSCWGSQPPVMLGVEMPDGLPTETLN